MTSYPVLILQGNDATELAIIRSLQIYNIPIYIISRGGKKTLSSYSKYTTKTIYLQDPLLNEQEFIISLRDLGIELLHRYKKRILNFATDDSGLLLLAKHYALLKKYFVILGDPDENDILKYSQKAYFFQRLQDAGCQEFIPITSPCFKEEDIERIKKEIPLPSIIKPSEKDISMSFYNTHKAKIIVIKDKQMLEEKLLELLSKGYKLVVQEMVTDKQGREVCWWGYRNRNGEIFGITTREIRKFPPIGGTATFEVIEDIPLLHEYVARILKVINFWGMCEIPFMESEKEGRYKVVEINPRPWSQMLLATEIGFNFPYVAYNEIYENRLIKPLINKSKKKKWVNIEYDFLASVVKGREYNLLKRLITWHLQVFNGSIHPVWSFSDFKVNLAWATQLFKVAYKQVKQFNKKQLEKRRWN